MTLMSLVESLELNIRCCKEKLGSSVTGGYVGDLLSDVIANSDRGSVWITMQSHQNIVAVAQLKELAGIILVLGRVPDRETIEKAEKVGIPILSSTLPAFEVAGKLYALMRR